CAKDWTIATFAIDIKYYNRFDVW
nr:immunoglobulin heavy chain junction region [Macaca mulatta]